MQSERKTQKATYYMIPLTQNTQNRHTNSIYTKYQEKGHKVN